MTNLRKCLEGQMYQRLGMVLKEDNTLTRNGQEVANEMFNTHFPGSTTSRAAMRTHQRPKVVQDRHVLNHPKASFVTFSKVRDAFKEFHPEKASGPDEIKPIVLQQLDDTTIHYIVKLYKLCLLLGHVPEVWCRAKVVFLPKHGKESYQNPRSFRPISLSSFLQKGLEKIILWELEDKHLLGNLLYERQHAFRKQEGTDTALTEVCDKIESGILQGQNTLGVFLDIQGAFDNIRTTSITNAMRERNFPSAIVQWYDYYLQNRIATTKIEGEDFERYLSRGTPQGGVLSPLSWNLPFDNILRQLNKGPILTTGFADDACLLITGVDPESMVDLMQDHVNKMIKWGTDNGLKFNTQKTTAIVFTNKRKFTTKRILIFGEEIPYSKEVKYLGLVFDSKLKWNTHIQLKISKCKKLLYALKRAIGKDWGPNPKTLRWAYTGMVRPILTYGCHLWGPNLKQSQRNLLNRMNRLTCLNLAPVHRYTPSLALEIIFQLKPLHLKIQELALNTMRRIKSQIKTCWQGIGSSKRWGHVKFWENVQTEMRISLMPSQDITPNSEIP